MLEIREVDVVEDIEELDIVVDKEVEVGRDDEFTVVEEVVLMFGFEVKEPGIREVEVGEDIEEELGVVVDNEVEVD